MRFHWWTLPAALLAVLALTGASGSHGQSPSDPDGCLGTPEKMCIANTAYEVQVKTASGGGPAGTWWARTTHDPGAWSAGDDEMGIPIAGWNGATREFHSDFSIRTYDRDGGVDATFALDAEAGGNSVGYPSPGFLLKSGPTVQTHPEGKSLVTTYDLQATNEAAKTVSLQVTQNISLNGNDRTDTHIHVGYTVCNKGVDPRWISIKALVDAQTGPRSGPDSLYAGFITPGNVSVPLGNIRRYFDEDPPWPKDNYGGTWPIVNVLPFAGPGLVLMDKESYETRTELQGGGWVYDFQTQPLFVPLYDWPTYQDLPHPVTKPTHIALWNRLGDAVVADPQNGAETDHDWPTPPRFVMDGPATAEALAFYWGRDEDRAIKLGGFLSPTECHDVHTYVFMNQIWLPKPPYENLPPVAVAKQIDNPGTCQDSSIHLSAADSHDQDDTTLKHVQWDFGDGTYHPNAPGWWWKPSNVNVQKAYAQPGTYNVTLTVWDWGGDLNVNSTTIQVDSIGDPNCHPVIYPFEEVTAVGDGVHRPIQASDDDAADTLEYSLAGAPSGLRLIDKRFLHWLPSEEEVGTYEFQVCVTDPHGAHACADARLIIQPGGLALGIDSDDDGHVDPVDNCHLVANRDQRDTDDDGIGDACDPVDDRDGTTPLHATGGTSDDRSLGCQASDGDLDEDNIPDPCDGDLDGDGIPQRGPTGTHLDNCPFVSNPTQDDSDDDGIGDACATTHSYAGLEQASSTCPGCAGRAEDRTAVRSAGARHVGLAGLGLVASLAVMGTLLGVAAWRRRR